MKQSNPKRWTLTDAHRAQIPEWNARWERIIMSTDPIDFERTRDAVYGMCEAAKLPRPVVVRCLSPMQMVIVGAWAAAYWEVVGTHASTDSAAYWEVVGTTHASTDSAEYWEVVGITHASTDSAAYSATASATESATESATGLLRGVWEAARGVVLGKLPPHLHRQAESLALKGIAGWYSFYNGGSEWASWCCYLSFVRDVVGWSCQEHATYKHYEDAALHGGPRFMHRNFVLLSDRANTRKTEKINGVHRLHCEDGPALAWNCGTREWWVHGIRLPDAVGERVVLHPETITAKECDTENNAEVRRVMIERMGWPKYLTESDAKVLDYRTNDIDGTSEALMETKSGMRRLLCACRSTGRRYAPGVPREVKNCAEAQAWLRGGSWLRDKIRVISAS